MIQYPIEARRGWRFGRRLRGKVTTSKDAVPGFSLAPAGQVFRRGTPDGSLTPCTAADTLDLVSGELTREPSAS